MSKTVIVTVDQLGFTGEDGVPRWEPRGATVQLSDAEYRRLQRDTSPDGPNFPVFVEPDHPAVDDPLVRDGVPAHMDPDIARERLRAAYRETPPPKAKSKKK